MLAEFLHKHNDPNSFELCITHDDRVNDGSSECFEELSSKYSNVKFAKNTHEDAVEWLTKLLDYYESNNLFTPILKGLRENLEKFANKEFFDTEKNFLWLSSGMLYNKAIAISSGDTILVGPSDFTYMLRLSDLEDFVNNKKKDGLYYGKLHAIFARITNQKIDWLTTHVNEIHQGIECNSDFRWDSKEVFKDYLNYPSDLKDYYLPDFKKNEITSLASPDSIEKMYEYSEQAFANRDIQLLPNFHGVHVMTKKTYDKIGGFTEAFYGRALADDKMTKDGMKYNFGGSLPPKFSFAWLATAELGPFRGEPYPDNWEELVRQRDPWYGKHPLNLVDLRYLHRDLISNADFSKVASEAFLYSPPIRIMT
jgi:hypothetical protein